MSTGSSSGTVESPLVHLQKEILTIKESLQEIIFNNRILKRKINELTYENDKLYDCIYNTEIKVTNFDQYSRRNNVELQNISENIKQHNIESYVLKIFESIGIKIQSYDLVAVHRIGKFVHGKHRNVIVRFINSKNAFTCLKNCKNLKKSITPEYKNIYITENLCPTNKKLFNYLYKLKKEKTISSVWTFNGSVFFKMSDVSEERGQRIDHIDDVEYYLSKYSEAED